MEIEVNPQAQARFQSIVYYVILERNLTDGVTFSCMQKIYVKFSDGLILGLKSFTFNLNVGVLLRSVLDGDRVDDVVLLDVGYRFESGPRRRYVVVERDLGGLLYARREFRVIYEGIVYVVGFNHLLCVELIQFTINNKKKINYIAANTKLGFVINIQNVSTGWFEHFFLFK